MLIVDLGAMSRLVGVRIAQARKLMSEEHKALGRRPPAGSLAEAAEHPDGAATKQPTMQSPQRVVSEDGVTVEGGVAAQIDLNFIGQGEPFVPIPS